MKTYKRALSNAQANACENAKHPVCRCRCGGRLHGKGHALYRVYEKQAFQVMKVIDDVNVSHLVDMVSDPTTQQLYKDVAGTI